MHVHAVTKLRCTANISTINGFFQTLNDKADFRWTHKFTNGWLLTSYLSELKEWTQPQQKNDPTQKMKPTQPNKFRRYLPKNKENRTKKNSLIPPIKWRRPATINEDEQFQTPSEHIDFCNGAWVFAGVRNSRLFIKVWFVLNPVFQRLLAWKPSFLILIIMMAQLTQESINQNCWIHF